MTVENKHASTGPEQVTLKRHELIDLRDMARLANDLALAATRLLRGPGKSESDDRLRIEAAFAVATATLSQIEDVLQTLHELDPTIEAEQ